MISDLRDDQIRIFRREKTILQNSCSYGKFLLLDRMMNHDFVSFMKSNFC